MRKQYITYIILCLTLGIITLGSCSRLEDDLFADKGPTRVQDAMDTCRSILAASEHGWAMTLFPNPEKYGAFYFAMKFTAKGQVTMLGDEVLFGTGQDMAKQRSLYTLYNGQGPTLKFDTYNLLHELADPEKGPSSAYGKGWEGDIEFILDSISVTKDVIYLKGKKRQNIVKLVKLTESPEEYMAKINANLDKLLNNPTFFRELTLEGDKKVSFMGYDLVQRNMNAVYVDAEDYVKYASGAVAVTTDGLQFYEPLEIMGETFQTFTNQGDTLLVDDKGRELMNVKRPSFTFPRAVEYMLRNDQPNFGAASPSILDAISTYEETTNDKLESKGYLHYSFILFKDYNVEDDNPTPTYPHAFCSTLYCIPENTLYLNEAAECKITTTQAEDEVLFEFNTKTWNNPFMGPSKNLKTVLDVFKTATSGMVVVPSEDYQTFTLVNINNGKYIVFE